MCFNLRTFKFVRRESPVYDLETILGTGYRTRESGFVPRSAKILP